MCVVCDATFAVIVAYIAFFAVVSCGLSVSWCVSLSFCTFAAHKCVNKPFKTKIFCKRMLNLTQKMHFVG